MTRLFQDKGFTPLLRARAGFTLLEIMFAAAILVTVLCGILATYISCFELISISRNLTLAMNACQEKIEEIRDFTFSQIATFYTTPPNDTFTVAEMLAGNSMGVVSVDSTNPDLLEITVAMCWRQMSGRIIGEDLNLNGVLDAGEDGIIDANGIIDSVAQIITLITQR